MLHSDQSDNAHSIMLWMPTNSITCLCGGRMLHIKAIAQQYTSAFFPRVAQQYTSAFSERRTMQSNTAVSKLIYIYLNVMTIIHCRITFHWSPFIAIIVQMCTLQIDVSVMETTLSTLRVMYWLKWSRCQWDHYMEIASFTRGTGFRAKYVIFSWIVDQAASLKPK